MRATHISYDPDGDILYVTFGQPVKSARIFYCFKPGGVIVLLHGFTKKSQKTPQRELQIATTRMEEV